MATIELKGLKGLDGLSQSEYNSWKQEQIKAGKITNNTKYSQLDRLYRNQQFIQKYGERI
jgi:hypothetical protein